MSAQNERSEESKKQAEEQREVILNSICSRKARERLHRVSLVKPEKARELEDRLIQLGINRALPGKVTEQQLISMLEQSSVVSGHINIIHKQGVDSDDDYDLEDL